MQRSSILNKPDLKVGDKGTKSMTVAVIFLPMTMSISPPVWFAVAILFLSFSYPFCLAITSFTAAPPSLIPEMQTACLRLLPTEAPKDDDNVDESDSDDEINGDV